MQRDTMMIGNIDSSNLQTYPHLEIMWDKTTARTLLCKSYYKHTSPESPEFILDLSNFV